MKQLYKILFVFCMTQFPLSCNWLDCGSDDPPVNGEIAVIDSDFVFYDDTDGFFDYSSNFTLLHTDAALRVFVDEINHVALAKPGSFSLISGAYACQPNDPVIFEQEIESIAIVAQDAFAFAGMDFLIGDTVNHLFEVADFGSISIDDFITEQNARPEEFGQQGSDMILRLNQPVTDTLRVDFNVSVFFKDGAVHRTSTPEYRVH